MSKIQLLVTSMHQKDLELVRKMNISSDVLIANQADAYEYCKQEVNGNIYEMVTTATRGTSRNRNIAIACSSPAAEYIMFLDDDLVLHDGYVKIIEEEFLTHPDAEAIQFNIVSKGYRKLSMKQVASFQKATMLSVAGNGVWCLAIKRTVLLEKNIRFNESFGPGTAKYCGEDSIFLQELLKKHVRFYRSQQYIADIYQTTSTWFEGYNERYFMVSGMALANVYPLLSRLIVIRSAYRFLKRKTSGMGYFEILRCYQKGIQQELKIR